MSSYGFIVDSNREEVTLSGGVGGDEKGEKTTPIEAVDSRRLEDLYSASVGCQDVFGRTNAIVQLKQLLSDSSLKEHNLSFLSFLESLFKVDDNTDFQNEDGETALMIVAMQRFIPSHDVKNQLLMNNNIFSIGDLLIKAGATLVMRNN